MFKKDRKNFTDNLRQVIFFHVFNLGRLVIFQDFKKVLEFEEKKPPL